jgi:ATP-dependent helicase/nuclease subunit A
MRTYDEQIDILNPAQKAAARIGTNAVIAAGAGSGKTKVLAARYLHLVVEKGLAVDEILALTFTNKAAAEMHGRIYKTLRETDHPLAKKAADAFNAARIETIDAFCNSVSRSVCRAYGVSPDFRIDETESKRLAEDLALPFFLEHRKSPAIRHFLRSKTQQDLASGLFAGTMVKYSPVSAPPDFAVMFGEQKKEVMELFGKTVAGMYRDFDAVRNAGSEPASKQWAACDELMKTFPDAPEAGDRDSIIAFIDACERFTKLKFAHKSTSPVVAEIREIHANVRESFKNFLALANWVLNERIIAETFDLLAEFQVLYHERKRTAGLMTYGDVSRMAVDALTADPELRAAHKKAFRAIMIDEFQDDNEMQRNLLFLISERAERNDDSVPEPADLVTDKLFFVGDEKQSIYRFRGADVSVFRKLADDLGSHAMPSLDTNYRTEKGLIDIFNALFPRVFLNPKIIDAKDFPLFEATFSPIVPGNDTPGLTPALDIVIVPKKRNERQNPAFETPENTEAAAVAAKIRELLDAEYPVRDKDAKGDQPKTRPCTVDDFAILFRSGTKQNAFEQQLREHNVPYQAENLKGLFDDAPVNDLYAMLRLAVWPSDNTAYANLLRSPFVGIGDDGFVTAISARTTGLEKGCAMPAPFDPAIDGELSESDRERFARGRERYFRVREMADAEPIADIVERLWYGEGYRHAVLSDAALHRYLELHDYFYELARQADAKGRTLAAFLDHVRDLMENEKKIDDLDVPVERTGGVRLTTVHKSKGLEYPVVFIVDSGNSGNADRNGEITYCTKEDGVSINTGSPEGAASASANWFYAKGRDENARRQEAELRRLLYVAMTRAETRLFITGVYTYTEGPDEIPAGGDALAGTISKWVEKKDENAKTRVSDKSSFFDLLLPAIAGEDIPGCTVTALPPTLRQPKRNKDSDGKEPKSGAPGRGRNEASLYEAAATIEYPRSQRTRYRATGLHAESEKDIASGGNARGSVNEDDDELSGMLGTLGIPANDFGTYAHRAIEARFTGESPQVPDEIRAVTDRMADKFMDSDLGKKSRASVWKETEYGFITTYEYEGRAITVTGQIDLLFEYEGTVYVVDYKTDREENPEAHEEQLAVYRKAAGDLFGLPVETWLFYLRTGNAVRA